MLLITAAGNLIHVPCDFTNVIHLEIQTLQNSCPFQSYYHNLNLIINNNFSAMDND